VSGLLAMLSIHDRASTTSGIAQPYKCLKMNPIPWFATGRQPNYKLTVPFPYARFTWIWKQIGPHASSPTAPNPELVYKISLPKFASVLRDGNSHEHGRPV